MSVKPTITIFLPSDSTAQASKSLPGIETAMMRAASPKVPV